jgi:hypothetical protein
MQFLPYRKDNASTPSEYFIQSSLIETSYINNTKPRYDFYLCEDHENNFIKEKVWCR